MTRTRKYSNIRILSWPNIRIHFFPTNPSPTYRYIKCLKLFFVFSKYSSVTAMLLQLGVHIVLHNAKLGFYTRLSCFTGAVVNAL